MVKSTTLVIMRGLPASGKTTWARGWVSNKPEYRARVNRDDLRAMAHDGLYIAAKPALHRPGTEPIIAAARDTLILSLLRGGLDVVCDDTNLPEQTFVDLCALAAKVRGTLVRTEDLRQVPLETCLKRNAERPAATRVPDDAIVGMWERHVGHRGAQPPGETIGRPA